ncbi:MAG: glycosyltransferase family 4 protein [Lachnospiraceae bacterium]|nr:glycosyltransferase family 4 protein [Lachnospiraceae bacterium]
MNIIYITLSEPRLSEHGIYPDLVRALIRASHHVTIVYAASPRQLKKTELTKEQGATILRVVVGENFDVGLIGKGINALKMEPLLKQAIRKYLKDARFDLCLYATPPVTFAGVAAYCKKHYGAGTFLMLKDIFPQNGVDIGLFGRNSLIHRYFRRKEKKLYALSDRIGCMSEGNLRYIREHEPWLDPKKLLVFPNTIEVEEETQRTEAEEDQKTRFLFGGNLGKPQAVSWLLAAMADERLTAREDIAFLIAGQGSEKEAVVKAAAAMPNLTYYEQLPTEEYDRLAGQADVGLISLDHRFTIPNYPSRILGYMKAEKPVLACTDEATDIRELVEKEAKCGLWCSSDDEEGFVQSVLWLADHREQREEMGRRGRSYLKQYFSVERSVRLLEESTNQ